MHGLGPCGYRFKSCRSDHKILDIPTLLCDTINELREKGIMFDEKLIAELGDAIETRIKRYHKDFSLCMMAELWEEILYRSMIDIGLDTAEWDNDRSHKIGEDISEDTFGRISCKSGALDRTGRSVKFNGSRTTAYKTIEEKMEFFSESHDDVYFLLAKNDKDIRSKNFKYKLLIFSSSTVKPTRLNWEETYSKKDASKLSGWKGSGVEGLSCIISKAMSDQLWTTVSMDMIEKTGHVIEIDANPE